MLMEKVIIIPSDLDNPKSFLHPTSMMDRPHIIFNKNAKISVMIGGISGAEVYIRGSWTRLWQGQCK